MAPFNRFRLFHWLLACFFVAVYLSGDDAERLHIWLGYGLVALLVLRLLIAPLRLRGFPRLLPTKAGRHTALGTWLTFGTLVSAALASLIGLGMVDNGEVLAALPGVQPGLFGLASDLDFVGWLGDAEELHEFFANLALWLIGLHIAYVLLYRRASVGPMLRGLPKQASASAFAPASPPAEDAFVRLRITARHTETADTCSFILQVPPGQHARFAALPGQFLTLKVPCAEPAVLRCYSLSLPLRYLSSQPLQADGSLRITVKRVATGRASNWLHDHLQPGDSIEALPPAGLFVPRSLDTDLLLLGAGSGIAPLMAILQAALQQGRARVCLFYANRDAEGVIFGQELAALQRRHGQRLELRSWFDVSQGLPDARAIATQVADWRAADCFVCGPQGFMDQARAALDELGVAAERIHLERFDAATRGTPHKGRRSRLRVRLAGQQHAVEVRHGQVLLEAMEQAGLQPPSGCRSGVCAACKCRVTRGSVTMLSNQALSEQQVRQGWTLACQAVPDSAELEVEY